MQGGINSSLVRESQMSIILMVEAYIHHTLERKEKQSTDIS